MIVAATGPPPHTHRAHPPQVQYWAPGAAGGGVTLVMAYLNGNHIPNLLRFSTLITKFVGTVAAVGGGLPMGPEGPMVHLGHIARVEGCACALGRRARGGGRPWPSCP